MRFSSRWSSKGNKPNGEPVLHLNAARFYWNTLKVRFQIQSLPRQRDPQLFLFLYDGCLLSSRIARQDYTNAQKHFVRGEAVDENAAMLKEWLEIVFEHERDLLLTRAVLQSRVLFSSLCLTCTFSFPLSLSF